MGRFVHVELGTRAEDGAQALGRREGRGGMLAGGTERPGQVRAAHISLLP